MVTYESESGDNISEKCVTERSRKYVLQIPISDELRFKLKREAAKNHKTLTNFVTSILEKVFLEEVFIDSLSVCDGVSESTEKVVDRLVKYIWGDREYIGKESFVKQLMKHNKAIEIIEFIEEGVGGS